MQEPHKLPELTVAEASAVIAVGKGEATPDQQLMAFKVICEKISNMYGFHFHPESSRNTDFALGKAQVGQIMVGIVMGGTEPFRQMESRKKTPPQLRRGKHG